MKSNELIIYTDGGSRGNPGPASVGIVIKNYSGELIKTYAKRIGEATNNEAEYQAVIFALQKAKALFGGEKIKNMKVEFRIDSELVGKQLAGAYKIEEEKLFPLFIKVWNLRMDFKGISFHIIPREKNREADHLVNEALNSSQNSLLE